ncbi:MAG: hypothetical protein ACM3UN_03205 [Bacillota bacterium]
MGRLFSYVLRFDTGLAPNPFGGYCTLALCKPKIRLTAEKGDWVVGTGSSRKGLQDRLVYAMLVTEKLTFNQYYTDKRFATKIPTVHNKIGDNIYFRGKQQLSFIHGSKEIARDTSGEFVLVSEPGNFYYYGINAKPIREKFPWIFKTGLGYKCKFTDLQIADFVKWIRKQEPGCHGQPIDVYSKANDFKQKTPRRI